MSTPAFDPNAKPDFGAGVVITDANKFAGSGFLDSYTFLIKSCNDIKTADDADKAALGVAIGLGAVATVVDTVKLVLNPLGSLISAGLGWLIEHVSFLREPLDMLMGDPDQIQLLSEEVHRIAEQIRQIGKEQTESLKGDIAEWKGQAADAFNARMQELAADLDAKAHGADVVGYLIQTNMAIIAAVRALFRDLITTVLGDIISTMLIALASAVFTFGASLVAGVGWCVTQATLTATSMASKLSAVIAQAGRSGARMNDVVLQLRTRPNALPPPRPGGTPPPRPTSAVDNATPPPRPTDTGAPPPRPTDDAAPPPRPTDDAAPPPRPADDDAASVDSFHTANETPTPPTRPTDDAAPPPRPADDDAASVDSFHTANETPTPPTRPTDDAAPPPRPSDDTAPPPRPSDDAAPPARPTDDAAPPPPAQSTPWTKMHEDWLRNRMPDAWNNYKSIENYLRDNHPDSFKLFKQWIADSDGAKEYWSWPIKGTQEFVKQMLDIQKTAEAGWAAEQPAPPPA